mmetsp:Transcript_61707/g.130223  ORF Transcript_61707/g.130223 Transcript_61707/m.130223 type:complete len:278 (+) Transcript_61707:839-1672(+)
MFNLLVIGIAGVVRQKFNSSETSEFHFFASVHSSRGLVIGIDDIATDLLSPLPAFFLADALLNALDLLVELPQSHDDARSHVRSGGVDMLDGAAHLAEAQRLHRLFGVFHLWAAADHDGSSGETTECWLEHLCQPGVAVGNGNCFASALAVIEGLDASLQGQEPLIDVPCFCQPLSALVVFAPRSEAGSFRGVIGATLRDTFASSKIRQEELRGDRRRGRFRGVGDFLLLHHAEDHETVCSSTSVVHGGLGAALALIPLGQCRAHIFCALNGNCELS